MLDQFNYVAEQATVNGNEVILFRMMLVFLSRLKTNSYPEHAADMIIIKKQKKKKQKNQ